MLETSARLLRLLPLLQTRPDWSGAELADRLGITTRTLRRDVRRLRDLGYPVHAAPGVAGGYRLGPGAAMPPLLLDDDEAVAIAISLRSAASQTVTGIAESSVRALAKLEQVLPARLRARMTALQMSTVPLNGPAARVDPASLVEISGACRDRRRLRLRYTDHRGVDTVRKVEPHRLVNAGYRWYLVARDVDRDDWRTFRVDRITSPQATGPRFTPHNAPDAAAFVADAISAAPYRYRARVLVSAPASRVAELVPPTVAVIEAVAEDSCTLTTGADSLDGIAFHLVMLDTEFTVLEPPELIARIQVIAARLQSAVATGCSAAPTEG